MDPSLHLRATRPAWHPCQPDAGRDLYQWRRVQKFTPHNSILALHTGETYKVTGSGAEPAIKEKKLDSFHFENLGNDRYRVLHKSGLVEVLQVGGSSNDRVALPVEIYSPAGHSIKLVYAVFRGGQRLESISDAQGELLRINRPNDTRVEILARPYDGPGGGPLARYEMNLNASGWVTSIVLPTEDKASWRLSYGLIRDILCLQEIKTPAGGRETLDYTDAGHPYPGGVTRPNLPRVTRHRSYPGFDQPMIQVDYSYTAHNFLGAGETVIWEDGMDPLYKVVTSYEYGSSAKLMDGTTVVRTVESTYSRFHLLTEEKTTQQQCIKRIKTEYYAKDVPFEQQVAQFQLPQKVTTSWELANDATQYRAEVALSAYDEHGNQTEQVEPNGIKTTYTYYPKAGEAGFCPPDRFVRNLKDTLITPSPDGAPGAATLRTRLRYGAYKPLTGSGLQDWLAIESETQVQLDGSSETTLQHTERTYHVRVGLCAGYTQGLAPRLRIDQINRPLTRQRRQQVVHRTPGHGFPRFMGGRAHVRRGHHIVQLQQRRVVTERLALEHVQPGGANLSFAQGLDQRRFIHDFAP
jgi:hypothetical protein